jgi:carbon storage regulator CsrA
MNSQSPVREDSMLVLSRKLDEEIVIAGDIRVRVLELRRGRVRLGVCAPRNVTVDRAEIVFRNCCRDADELDIPEESGGLEAASLCAG